MAEVGIGSKEITIVLEVAVCVLERVHPVLDCAQVHVEDRIAALERHNVGRKLKQNAAKGPDINAKAQDLFSLFRTHVSLGALRG